MPLARKTKLTLDAMRNHYFAVTKTKERTRNLISMNGNNSQSRNGSSKVGIQDQQQRQQQQQSKLQPKQQNPTAPGGVAQDQSGLVYDFSSFDPLQAHALQLTASAGLTTLLANPSAPTTTALSQRSGMNGDTSQKTQLQQPLHHQQPQTNQPEKQHQHQQQQLLQQPTSQHLAQQQQQAQQSQQPQPSYYYIQPNGSATSSLTPIAPTVVPQTVASAMVPQAPIVAQTAPNFLLSAAAPGATLAMPTNFQAPIFPNTLPAAAATSAAPGMIPSLLMTQHFQSQLVPAAVVSKKRIKEDPSMSKQQQRRKKRQLEPSVVSSTTSTDSSGHGIRKDARIGQESSELMDPQVDLAKMTPAERRRHERNLREQQRSSKISQQIKELREVLTESNVPYKPNKYSILLSVVEYIKQLQSRAIMLDAEHQKLITTIRQTNEMVNSGIAPSSADETDATNITGNTSSSDPGSDSEMIFVQKLNYKSVFASCPAALGIAALDGRILECNSEFQLLLGFPREEVLKQSLFNLVQNHQDIFQAMAEMLRSAEDEPIALARDSPSSSSSKNCIWSGPVLSKRDTKLFMNLTLTSGDDGAPKYFNCSVTYA